METPKSKPVKFNSQSSYPLTDSTIINSANSITLENVGENVVNYLLTKSGDTGALEKGQKVVFDTDGGLISDEIILEFIAPGEIDINWVESETSIIEEQKKTNHLLSVKEPAYAVNLSDVETGTATFPMVVDTLQANYTESGTTLLDTAPIGVQTFATISDLISVWNVEIDFYKLSYKDESSFYILPGTKPLPNNDINLPLADQSFVSFNNNSAFVFRVFRSVVFADAYIGELSNIDQILFKTDQILLELQSVEKSDEPSQYYEASPNIDITITDFTELNFLTNGIINVTIGNDSPVIYPFNLGVEIVRGMPIVCRSKSKKPVRFQGSGILLVNYVKSS